MWGPPKVGSRAEQKRRSFTWRFRPTLISKTFWEPKIFETKTEIWETIRSAFEIYRHRIGRRAAGARRHRLPELRSKTEEQLRGKTSDEKASRGAPQTMPQMAWLFPKSGKPEADSRHTGALTFRKEIRKRYSSRQDVPVRQTRVAERDVDVAVSSFEATRTKRNVMRWSGQSADQTLRGRRLSSAWQASSRNCVERNGTCFFG